ncbi:MAG: CPBP family intramembrane glutamic endopeptidase [Bacteroidia bacterium]|nr:CPBP family intramembrane metalloprotease [Bacteroidia bacterium]MDW8159345.1 CPBP family intramembrane glutamic endopeptidase [Bacteroidia bacterium]
MFKLSPIIHYTILTYILSWSILLSLHLLNVKWDSPSAFYAIGLGYMSSPAIVSLLLGKWVYGISWADLGLSWQDISWKAIRNITFFFLAWIFLFFSLYFILGNILEISWWGKLNFTKEFFRKTYTVYLQKQGVSPQQIELVISYGPFFTLITGIISSIFLGYFFSLPFYVGQELGWRGFLQKQALRLGFWKSNLLVGAIWGIWLLPLTILGKSFPSYAWGGIPVMLIHYLIFSFWLCFLRYYSGSILGSAIFHGMIAGFSQFLLLYIEEGNELIKNNEGINSTLALGILTIVILSLHRNFISHYPQIFVASSVAQQQNQEL